MPVESMWGELKRRCTAVEECYDFMLAFAARGVSGDSQTGGPLRSFLSRCAEALIGLGDLFGRIVDEEGLQPAADYHAFIAVLDRDARDAQAAIELVLAQSAINSQMIDNLNASIHIRTLLTDIFLIDEIIKPRLATNSAAIS